MKMRHLNKTQICVISHPVSFRFWDIFRIGIFYKSDESRRRWCCKRRLWSREAFSSFVGARPVERMHDNWKMTRILYHAKVIAMFVVWGTALKTIIMSVTFDLFTCSGFFWFKWNKNEFNLVNSLWKLLGNLIADYKFNVAFKSVLVFWISFLFSA